MASELSVSASINFSKSGITLVKSHNITTDVAGDAFTYQVQSIGTVEEAIEQGTDVGTPGYLMIKNTDSTNYVEIGSTSGVYDIKISAGEIALYRHNSAIIYAKANTGACVIEYVLIEA